MAKGILPETSKRVKLNTSKKVNEQIYRESLMNMERYVDADKDEISERIEALDKEWDTERVLEANASALIVLSALLGFTVNKKWFALGGIVASFLFQHSLQGWCPPLPIIRRLGIRTESEIEMEKNLLKSLRER